MTTSNESFESMRPLPNTPAENQALAQERAKQAQQTHDVEARQEEYVRRAETARSLGGSSIPALPAGASISLSRAMQKELMTLEYSTKRAEKAKRLPDMVKAVKDAERRAANVFAHLQKAQQKLAKMNEQIGQDRDDPQQRLSQMSLVGVLVEDHNRLMQEVMAKRSSVTQLETELHDTLVSFCEARVQWIDEVLKMLPALRVEAQEVLEAKEYEVEHGKPHPSAKSRTGPDLTAAMKPNLPSGWTDLGIARTK